jgi:hypothetical protein
MVTQTTDLTRLVDARDRGAEYLLSRQRADGAVGEPGEGLGCYYKASYAFAASGRTAAGARLVAWIRRHMFSPEGDVRGEFERGPLSFVYTYPNAWIVCGAQKLGQLDVARRGVDFIATLQDGETGGFRTQLDKPQSVQDVMSACMSGMAALYAGHLDVARGVARFLATVWEAQPEPEAALYYIYRPGSGLVTETEPEKVKNIVVRVAEPRQRYFQIGIATAFLTKLAQATGDDAHLGLARSYLELAFHATDAMYETAQVGKVGWGAAMLYGATGDERVGGLAARAGEALLDQQNDDGSWDNTGGFSTEAVRDEVTAEFVSILDDMAQGLSSA